MVAQKQDAPLERIRRLIALTSSPSIEEARTAAYQACRLIREFDVQVGAALPANDTFWSSYQPPPRPRPAPPPRPTDGHKCIVTKFESMCSHCGEKIHVGQDIAWCRGKASYHWSCHVERMDM